MRGRWCAPSPLRFWTSRSLLPASRAGWGSSCRGRTERGEVLHTSAALTTIERPKRDLRFGVGHESNRWTALKAERRANLKSTAATNAAAPPTSRRPLRAFTCQRQGRDLGRDWDWCRRAAACGEGREGKGADDANLVNRSRHLQLKASQAAVPTVRPRHGQLRIHRTSLKAKGRPK